MILEMTLRWLDIASWCVRPGPLNTATESRPMHATVELKMKYVEGTRPAHAQIYSDLVPLKFLANLHFDQEYL